MGLTSAISISTSTDGGIVTLSSALVLAYVTALLLTLSNLSTEPESTFDTMHN